MVRPDLQLPRHLRRLPLPSPSDVGSGHGDRPAPAGRQHDRLPAGGGRGVLGALARRGHPRQRLRDRRWALRLRSRWRRALPLGLPARADRPGPGLGLRGHHGAGSARPWRVAVQDTAVLLVGAGWWCRVDPDPAGPGGGRPAVSGRHPLRPGSASPEPTGSTPARRGSSPSPPSTPSASWRSA